MPQEIKHQWFYSQPPQEVWDYLTNADLMELWLMKNDFKPVPGHAFRFLTRAMPQFGFDGIILCRVLEVIPLKKLSYSWKSGPGEGLITLDSVVVWTLQPKENGTELLLEHSGFKDLADSPMFAIMNEGWLKNIKKIAQLIQTP